MVHRFFRFIGSVVTYVFEEMVDSHKTKPRLEPTISAFNAPKDKDLPPIHMD